MPEIVDFLNELKQVLQESPRENYIDNSGLSKYVKISDTYVNDLIKRIDHLLNPFGQMSDPKEAEKVFMKGYKGK